MPLGIVLVILIVLLLKYRSSVLVSVISLSELVSCHLVGVSDKEGARVGVSASHSRFELTAFLVVVLVVLGVTGQWASWGQLPMRNPHVIH